MDDFNQKTSMILDIIFTIIIIAATYYLIVEYSIVAGFTFIILIELREIMVSLRSIDRHIKGIDKTLLNYVAGNPVKRDKNER